MYLPLVRSHIYRTAKHCAENIFFKNALFLINSKGLLLALQLWWAESCSPHLDPVKHLLQIHIRSDFHPIIALWSIREWVCEAPERGGSLNTCLSGTVTERWELLSLC